ncbi:unnamed protein product [Caenorhabditis brenneri]
MRKSFLCLLIHAIFDVSSTILSLGFYSPGWHFDLDHIIKTIDFANYSYWTSPLDFVILSLLRQVSLQTAVMIARRGNVEQLRGWMWIYDVLAIVGYMVAILKFLASDVTTENMQFPGLYMNTGSTSTEDHLLSSENFWKILKLYKKEWKWYIPAYVLLVIDCVLSLFIPTLQGEVIGTAVQMKSFDVLSKACINLAIVNFSKSTLSLLGNYCRRYARSLTARDIPIELFRSVIHQSIAFFDENKTGELMSRITHDSKSISNSLPKNFEDFANNLFLLIGSVPIMLNYSWQISILIFIAFPMNLLLTKWNGSFVKKLSEEENEAIAAANGIVEEVISNIRTVRSFAAEKKELLRYTQNKDAWFKISTKGLLAGIFYSYFYKNLLTAVDLLIPLYGSYLALNGRMDSEALTAYILYSWDLQPALDALCEVYPALMKTIGSSGKVVQILNRPPGIDIEFGTETPEIVGKIVFENVEFAYPTRKNVNVLNGINLTIESGKTTALVGPSGNGKSTIVSLIERFYAPQSGRILLDGLPIEKIDHQHYHAHIALVSQEPTLFSGTIRENIMYGMDNATEEEMIDAAKKANVYEFVSNLEEGFDTKCGANGVQMSGGQKQRIAIARALIRNPRVLILDEATSALDAETEYLVQKELNEWKKGRTLLIIAHRLSTIKKADNIVVI